MPLGVQRSASVSAPRVKIEEKNSTSSSPLALPPLEPLSEEPLELLPVVVSAPEAVTSETVIPDENIPKKKRKPTRWTKHRRRVANAHSELPWRSKLVRAQITYKPTMPRSLRRIFRYAYDYLHSKSTPSVTASDAELNAEFVDVMLDYINAGEARGDVDMKMTSTPEDSSDESEPDTVKPDATSD